MFNLICVTKYQAELISRNKIRNVGYEFSLFLIINEEEVYKMLRKSLISTDFL